MLGLKSNKNEQSANSQKDLALVLDYTRDYN